MAHVLTLLSRRYPQLLLPVEAGMSQSAMYQDAVRLGKCCNSKPEYTMSEKDRLELVDTPVGPVELLLLHNRADFETCACALVHRCEPRQIPGSVGAFMISGLVNWEKIRELTGKHFFASEYERNLTLALLKAQKKAYTDRIILLSTGYYSGVRPEQIGLSEEDWIEKSVIIRTWHELTHFICRMRCPQNVSPVRDEVLADMIGLLAAFGRYDAHLAKLFLGIAQAQIPAQARIRYYIREGDVFAAKEEAQGWIQWLQEREETAAADIFTQIMGIFDDMKQ